MNRPNVKIEMQLLDWLLEITGVLLVMALIGYPLTYFGQLPETIPTHFNALGEADGFSGKSTIWLLPIVGSVMYFLLAVLSRFPRLFNLPVTITEENAEVQYRLGSRLMRVLNIITVGIFFYISYSSLMQAMGVSSGLGGLALPMILSITFVPIIIYYILAKRNE